MHYKNGREAKNGDKIVMIPIYSGANPMVGILYDAVAGNDTCNGRIAPVSNSDPYPNLKECLHLDDVHSALAAASSEKWLENYLDTVQTSRFEILEGTADMLRALFLGDTSRAIALGTAQLQFTMKKPAFDELMALAPAVPAKATT